MNWKVFAKEYYFTENYMTTTKPNYYNFLKFGFEHGKESHEQETASSFRNVKDID